MTTADIAKGAGVELESVTRRIVDGPIGAYRQCIAFTARRRLLGAIP